MARDVTLLFICGSFRAFYMCDHDGGFILCPFHSNVIQISNQLLAYICNFTIVEERERKEDDKDAGAGRVIIFFLLCYTTLLLVVVQKVMERHSSPAPPPSTISLPGPGRLLSPPRSTGRTAVG